MEVLIKKIYVSFLCLLINVTTDINISNAKIYEH